jgi:transcriptional regulator with XRE-family HTH domain
MPRTVPPDLSVALTFLRSVQGWSQADLGKAAGLNSNLLNDYERGRKTLTRERLEHLVAVLGLPPDAIDAALGHVAATRAMGKAPRDSADPLSAAQRHVEAVVARVQRMAADFARSTLTLLTIEGDALHARQRAELLWNRLKRYSPAQRRLALEKGAKFRTWALAERVAAESIRQAPNHPKDALALADLALLIAELIPGEATWRQRLQGYTWAHVANARRVCNDLPGADDALARAWRLWEAGEAGDPGVLNAAWLPWIEAALRKGQRRFPEALKRIDEALALDQGELKSEILLSKARILETLGDPERSTAALSEAAPLIDSGREPRLAFGLRFNLVVDLCHLERFSEAEAKLPEVRALAERLSEELDMLRVVWLQGKVAAGLRRTEEARVAFEQVRQAFTQRELAYDCALVSLELALALLEQGRVAEVRTLAEEMLWIFRAQKVHREALAALQLFYDAAKREVATVEQTQQIMRFLYRAQHDPEIRFWGDRTEAEAR